MKRDNEADHECPLKTGDFVYGGFNGENIILGGPISTANINEAEYLTDPLFNAGIKKGLSGGYQIVRGFRIVTGCTCRESPCDGTDCSCEKCHYHDEEDAL